VREICDRNGILLIADEIQSGFGRTGRWFAVEQYDVVPDILTVAKGIASGLPLSGVAARRELMEQWVPGSHGGTYGGNAVACAAAVATIQAIRDERLLDNAQRMGGLLIERLREVQASHRIIGDVRGLGLMIGAEFTAPDGQPATEIAKAVVEGCLRRQLILLTCGPWSNTVRWIPPLIVTRDQIEQAVEVFQEAVSDCSS
jgi:4-aminobutyrate aminotransferase